MSRLASKLFFEIDDPLAGTQSCLELGRVEWLSNVVVRTGVHARDDRIRVGVSGQKKNIDVGAAGTANLATDLEAVHDRHHPVQNGYLRTIIRLEDLPGLAAIRHDRHLVAACLEACLEHERRKPIVIRDEDSHRPDDN